MEIQSFCYSADDLKGIMRCLVESLMVDTALLAHKSLLLLLLQIGSLPDDHDIFQNSYGGRKVIGSETAFQVSNVRT
ncbi:prostatic spermine-binding protein-like [Prunus yedoensis var. nudiflora]|uniref:Prostatic spermine-binding protein-like n=1 Tax=Prunus yedoensis var. nudiflora TaxID=2094558 RepID=A0A314ZKA1_PRUYE|nr:prostatic spermine-binding protein-like [Prunus yedoensis var. nudiflora]